MKKIRQKKIKTPIQLSTGGDKVEKAFTIGGVCDVFGLVDVPFRLRKRKTAYAGWSGDGICTPVDGIHPVKIR